MSETHTFTKGEEIANAITHGIGAILSIVALVFLIIQSAIHGNAWHVVSFTLFGSTMLLMYLCSTMLHSLPSGKAKDVFEIFDHSAIYFFIAGTYTPFLFLVIKGWLGWTIFGIVWGLAIAGTVFKSFFVKKFVLYSTLLYVLMGWLIVFAWKPLMNNLPQNAILLLVLGGLLYTLGSVFYVWRGFKYHHTLWHVFVIGGSVAHFFCVFLYLV
ncbi:PAQR family membrane homeostasis protein TrhA [Robertmurraya massiliosenegalensis]|uniref:PAQR family membrane homeostasis protein TrhA n=1 Tax=Robertmurraya massiliosenegalensis TaxID=1287657 RepID=UPI00031FF983|nr:hemolysin III family protein [Robertmurraya massiliosenegalensis]